MAKKAKADFGGRSRMVQMVKVVRCIKNEETGSYNFREDVVAADNVKEIYNKK